IDVRPDRRLPERFAVAGARRGHQPARRPWTRKYANTVVQHAAATAYLAEGGSQLADDQNASMPAAISSMPVTPYRRTTESLVACTGAWIRASRPGASSACPTRRPAAPARTTAVNSNAECVAVNEKNVCDKPRCVR